MKDRLDANYKNLDRVISWIQNVDTKSSIVLAFNGAMIVVILDRLPTLFILIENHYCLEPILTEVIIVSLMVFLITFILSTYHALRVLLPDIKPRSEHKLFFFGTISQMDKESFMKKMSEVDEKEIIDNIAEQTFINSEIADNKFAHLKLSWKFLSIAIASSILTVSISIVVRYFF